MDSQLSAKQRLKKIFIAPPFLLSIRLFLLTLIVLEGIFIFGFSGEDAKSSTETSHTVAAKVAEVVDPTFPEKPKAEQVKIVNQINPPIRKLAHITEFGVFCVTIFLFLLTWKGSLLLKYGVSILLTVIYALLDEWHQIYSPGRAFEASDLLADTVGAILFGGALALFLLLCRRIRAARAKKLPIVTRQTIVHPACPKPFRLAIVADTHGSFEGKTLPHLEAERPDAILIPGDLMNRKRYDDESGDEGYEFLAACAKIAPTFFSLGNHDIGCFHSGSRLCPPGPPRPLTEDARRRIAECGVTLLDNDYTEWNGIYLCGLTSGVNGRESFPDPNALHTFDSLRGFRVLLCHHPEYYPKYVRETSIEITVSGHAHGGQWRFFGRGVYAPGQGLFPKYTSGVWENRLVVSRGVTNNTWIPRIRNKPEIVMLELQPKE